MKHRPGNNLNFFSSQKAAALIDRWKMANDLDALTELLKEVQAISERLIAKRRAAFYCEPEEIIQRVRIKLYRSVHNFKPDRGSPFSYLSQICNREISSAIGAALKARALAEYDEKDIVNGFERPGIDRSDELVFKLRQIKTTCSWRHVKIQRWIIRAILDRAPQTLPRAVAIRIASDFGRLPMEEGARIYDLTILSMRQAWPLPNGRQAKTRGLDQYAALILRSDFERLKNLLRGLSPETVLAIEPRNAAAILAGDAGATRTNLRYCLEGHPGARPLFR